jgi:hypothetical protein
MISVQKYNQSDDQKTIRIFSVERGQQETLEAMVRGLSTSLGTVTELPEKEQFVEVPLVRVVGMDRLQQKRHSGQTRMPQNYKQTKNISIYRDEDLTMKG